MDNMRRTISSEEQIGEALMRVSNTLEAQRLTKSLEFQEKARRRTRLRFVLSIVLLALLFTSLVVLGLFLFVLWKYMDPFLERFLPFASGMLDDFGTMWNALVTSSTYLPVFLEQFTRLNEELITLLQGVNSLDLKALINNLNNLLAATNGLLITTNGMLSGLSSMLGSLGAVLTPMLADLGNMLSQLSDAMAPMMGQLSEAFGNMDLPGMVEDLGTMLTDLMSTGTQFAHLASGAMTALSSAFTPEVVAKLNEAFSSMALGLPDMLNDLNGVLGNGATLINELIASVNPQDVSKITTNLVTATKGLSDAMAALGAVLGAFT